MTYVIYYINIQINEITTRTNSLMKRPLMENGAGPKNAVNQ